ncbi:hypothetical protein C8R43DRAFT_963133 [Mycena crocata]|nr:hypothetical protein C8R43DRAFT_963133 [Mycena crocata]
MCCYCHGKSTVHQKISPPKTFTTLTPPKAKPLLIDEETLTLARLLVPYKEGSIESWCTLLGKVDLRSISIQDFFQGEWCYEGVADLPQHLLLRHKFSTISLLIKEKLYINEVIIGTIFGIVVGLHCANIFDLRSWGESTNAVTLKVMSRGTRLLHGQTYQGVAYPYVIPTIAFRWVVIAKILHSLFPGLVYISCLAIAACHTPTDPIIATITQLTANACMCLHMTGTMPMHRRLWRATSTCTQDTRVCRKSMSTSDAEELALMPGKGLFNFSERKDDLLSDSIKKELAAQHHISTFVFSAFVCCLAMPASRIAGGDTGKAGKTDISTTVAAGDVQNEIAPDVKQAHHNFNNALDHVITAFSSMSSHIGWTYSMVYHVKVEQNKGITHPYHSTVMGRERKALHGKDCPCCADYYTVMAKQLPLPFLSSTRSGTPCFWTPAPPQKLPAVHVQHDGTAVLKSVYQPQ